MEMQWNDGVGSTSFNQHEIRGYTDFQKDCAQEKNAIFRQMVRDRIKMIQKAVSFRKNKNHCLDVWVSGGHFIREMNRNTNIQTHGTDINTYAVKWLHENEWLVNREKYEVLTFWGSFDRIPEPQLYFNEYKPRFVAISLPIFINKEQVLSSPYYKKEERRWYFTRLGLIKWMEDKKFSLLNATTDDDHKYGYDRFQSFLFAANRVI